MQQLTSLFSKLILRFDDDCEKAYRLYWCDKHIHLYHYRVWATILFFCFLLTGIIGSIPPSKLPLLYLTYGTVGFVLIVDIFLSHIKKLNAYYEVYLGISSYISITATIFAAFAIQSKSSDTLLYAGIMFPILVVLNYVGLRFSVASTTVIGGLVTGIGCVLYLQYPVDWPAFIRIIPATIVLGMILNHSYEQLDRQNYLKARQLEIAHLLSEQKNKLLDKLAKTDDLTGLANRRFMEEKLCEAWVKAEQGEPLSIFMIDIDFFKSFNDTLGHQAGDNCLVRIASCIDNMAKRQGELAARYGGEEFLVIYPYNRVDQLQKIAQNLAEKITAQEMLHPKSSISNLVTVSIGIATYSPSITPALTDLISHADTALYLAKESGRNGFVLYRDNL